MNARVLKILAVSLGLCVAAGNLVAQVTVTPLYSFGIYPSDGEIPYAGLVQGKDGNFYGTTGYGGMPSYGYGTIFEISPDGSYLSLYSFAGPPSGGNDPQAALVQGSDGNFYGTTTYGGTNGDGNVFGFNPNTGIETNLYSFTGYPNDGSVPLGALVQGGDGNFYGTTSQGGTNNDGIIFRISPGGVYTNLYSFAGAPTDGGAPYAGLVLGRDGNFYGTTAGGGTNIYGGTVFRFNPNTSSETLLYSFDSYPDGNTPQAALVQGSDGNFYGTTAFGGTNSDGTVFQFNPNTDSETPLYSFVGPPTDGNVPRAALVQGSDGNFYGTTAEGGTNLNSYDGTIFRISPGGSYTNFHTFVGYPSDGQNPPALVQGSDGNYYGTTLYGGSEDAGFVYRLTVPLSSPANQISAIQVAGANVLVTIPSIAGETYQLQDRTSLTAGAWADVAGQVISIGGLLTVTNFGGFSQPQQFYRFSIIP